MSSLASCRACGRGSRVALCGQRARRGHNAKHTAAPERCLQLPEPQAPAREHARARECMHARARTRARARTLSRTHTRARAHAWSRAHVRVRAQARKRASKRARAQALRRAGVCVLRYAHVRFAAVANVKQQQLNMDFGGGHGWHAAFREALETSGVARLLSPQAAEALNRALVARGAQATPRVLASSRVVCPDCSQELTSSRLATSRDPRAECVVFDLRNSLAMVHVPRWCKRCQQAGAIYLEAPLG